MRLLGVLKRTDWLLLTPAILLAMTGLVLIYNIAVSRGVLNLFYSQLSFILIGLVMTFFIARLDYRKFSDWVFWLYVAILLLLTVLLIWGEEQFGARRWIDLGIFQFQPSEIVKISLVFLMAKFMTSHWGNIFYKQLLLFLIFAALPIALVILQPDLGTAGILAFLTLTYLLAARLNRGQWFVIGIIGIVVLVMVAMNLQDYQVERLATFFSPDADPYRSGYNVVQSLIAIGSGGITGRGLNSNTQSQLEFLPVAHTDFIFASIAEAAGLVGSLAVLLLFAMLIGRALFLAIYTPDLFGSFLALGIASLWLIQFGINIGMNIGLVPVTGIPLPFVSYGGTAMIINFVALGLLAAVGKKSKQLSLLRY